MMIDDNGGDDLTLPCKCNNDKDSDGEDDGTDHCDNGAGSWYDGGGSGVVVVVVDAAWWWQLW